MADLHPHEKHLILAGTCPDCGGRDFFLGPRVGAYTELRCATEGCGARFRLCQPWFAERTAGETKTAGGEQ